MGARVESLPIPVGQPSKRWGWGLAAALAICIAAAASVLVMRNGSERANAPAGSRLAGSGQVQAITGTGNGLIEVANASANLTGHSLAYFTGGGPGASVRANASGHGAAFFTSGPGAETLAAYASSGAITGTGPGLAELSGRPSDSLSNSPVKANRCRFVRFGIC